jgi:aminoglycoside phosphotransferase (APT) family kinase protein
MARDITRMLTGLRASVEGGERITGIQTLSAGHSNETYLLEGLDRILRMPPSEEGLLPPYDMARQHAVLRAVKQHAPAVPVPEVYELLTDPEVIGDEFFVMQRLPGEAFEYAAPDWLAARPETADALCRQWFDALIALHNMPVEHFPSGGRSVRDEAQHWLDVAVDAEAPLGLIAVLADLVTRPLASSGPVTPVHGDPKHGNCMWQAGRLTAVLDWEMAQVSEPMLDLGYILMFHDQGEASLANAGFELPAWWSRARMVEAWEAGTGRKAVDIERYAILGQAKVAAIIALGAHLFNSGKIADPRFAAFAALVPAFTNLLIERAQRAG